MCYVEDLLLIFYLFFELECFESSSRHWNYATLNNIFNEEFFFFLFNIFLMTIHTIGSLEDSVEAPANW